MWRFGRRKERGVGCEGRRKGRHCSDGRRVVMQGTDLLELCTEAPGVYRVSRFLRGDHSRQAAEVCVHTTGG